MLGCWGWVGTRWSSTLGVWVPRGTMGCPFVAQQQILQTVELGSQKLEKMKLSIYSFRQGRGGYWAWRSNYGFILCKSGHESEARACPTVWKYSVLTWVSHTLTLEVTVCRKWSVIASSILSRNPFTLTSWPVLALQMYVSLCQTVLLIKKKRDMESIDQIKSSYSLRSKLFLQ